MIRDGFDLALDELRTAMRGGKDWIAKLQQDEITRTGIQSLKVRFNSVFGYYIEISKSYLGIDGSPDYAAAVQALIFGADHPIITDRLAVTAHTPGGTDSIGLGNALIQSSGTLTLQPIVPSTSIGIAGGTGIFNLDAADLDSIEGGFSRVVIGRADVGQALAGSQQVPLVSHERHRPVGDLLSYGQVRHRRHPAIHVVETYDALLVQAQGRLGSQDTFDGLTDP
jgi:hypothetical protein